MVRVGLYLIFILMLDVGFLYAINAGALPKWVEGVELISTCAAIGGLGGVVYCLRGIYLNACVRKAWDEEWMPWYFIRPVVSHVCGAVSYIFLLAGLLILEAGKQADASNFGIYALAFIAGLNVDKFIAKVEDVAQTAWGIEKSRSAKKEDER